MMAVILKIFVLLSFFTYSHCNQDLLVQTNNGVLRGKYIDIKSGKTIKAFLGIPFAEPPVGELRFKDPVSKENWDGIKDATNVHPVCPQVNIFLGKTTPEGVEDCLFLNVYSPKESSNLLPVMVFIHGGGYLMGTGNTDEFGPDVLLNTGNVVLVTINYRLGPLGFSATNDEVVHGNMGLKDQTLSLKWVRDNIKLFGGDPTQVTIFGESAGASSVHLQMLSPSSKGLFHAAISQSGTALCQWATESAEIVAEKTKILAEALNCSTITSRKMIECLRKIDALELLQTVHTLWGYESGIPFRPIIERTHTGAFINKHPRDIIKSGESADIPWIVGVNADEGAVALNALLSQPDGIEIYNTKFEEVAKHMLFGSAPKKITEKIKDFYLNHESSSKFNLRSIVDMNSDAWFVSCTDEAINLTREYSKQPIYYYLFDYRGSSSIVDGFGEVSKEFGAAHCDELQYLFLMGQFVGQVQMETEADFKMGDIMTALWTNFATHRKPTPIDATFGDIDWKPIETDKNEYLHIGEPMRMESRMFEERIALWRELRDDMQNMQLKDEL